MPLDTIQSAPLLAILLIAIPNFQLVNSPFFSLLQNQSLNAALKLLNLISSFKIEEKVHKIGIMPRKKSLHSTSESSDTK